MARFRILNPSASTIVTASVAAILAGLGITAYVKQKKKKTKKKEIKKEETNGDKEIADALILLISEDPAPGALYQIRSGDNFNNVSRAVFSAAGIPDARENGAARVAYMQCTSASPYNIALFGTPGDFTNGFPSYTSPDNVSLRSAFLNKSGDYLSMLLNGQIPTRTSGGRLGMLWLPQIDVAKWQEFGKIVCLQLDPPPLTIAE